MAIGTFRAQNQQAKRLVGIQILRDFEDKFFRSESIRRLRYVVCNHYKLNGLDAEVPPEGWRLADEFCSISLYVNKGYVDIDAAWETLYFWLDTYWFLFRGFADGLKAETGGVDYLSDFRKVHELLTRFGEKNRGLPPVSERHTPEVVARFLEYELAETNDSVVLPISRVVQSSNAEPIIPPDLAHKAAQGR